jgi:CBS domain-containing protein
LARIQSPTRISHALLGSLLIYRKHQRNETCCDFFPAVDTTEKTAMHASDVMRTSLVSINPTASLLEATQLLLKTNRRALPVMTDDDELR